MAFVWCRKQRSTVGKMTVLIVDDDESVREILAQALNLHGFTDIVQAQNGTDALEKIQQASHPFRCILMDIQMPGLTGIEVCRHIRTLSSHANVPIIMISSISDDGQKAEAFEAGACSFIAKPFEVVDVGLRIKEIRSQRATKYSEPKISAGPKAPAAVPVASGQHLEVQH